MTSSWYQFLFVHPSAKAQSSSLHFLQNVLSPFGTCQHIINSFSLSNTLKTYVSLYSLPTTGFLPSVEESRVCQASMWVPQFVVLYHLWTAFWPQHLVPLSLLHPTFHEPDITSTTLILDLWRYDQLEHAEASLTALINQLQNLNYHVLASQALVCIHS